MLLINLCLLNISLQDNEICPGIVCLKQRKPIGKLSEGGKLSEVNRVNPKCKKTAVNNEKGFLKRLHKYMNDRGRPIVRIPTLGFKEGQFSVDVCHSSRACSLCKDLLRSSFF